MTNVRKKPSTNEAPAGVAGEKKEIGYLQNKEGRVFVATPELLKQMKKGKFGLMRITKSVYDEALANGGMTAPLPEYEDQEDI